MRKLFLGLLAVGVIMLTAPRAEAKIAAVYASGQGGVQSGADAGNGLGFTLGARVLIFDGYFDYMRFGQDVNVSRGILGLRGGFGAGGARLVLRAGGGTIHEEGGALTGPFGAPSRTGVVGRVGAAVEARMSPLLYLGFGIDGERYRFPSSSIAPTYGSDILATLRLTFELGI
jgi:hypothetical protein